MQTEPEFGGECAFALSTGKNDVAGSPELALVDGDKIYLFKNRVARFLWKVLPDRSEKTSEAWAARPPR